MKYTKPKKICFHSTAPSTPSKFNGDRTLWCEPRVKQSKVYLRKKKSGIANYCLYASMSYSVMTTTPWLLKQFTEHPHQLLFCVLPSQTKSNKWTKSLPSSSISLAPSVCLCLPHLLISYPAILPPSISPSPSLWDNSEELIHLQNSWDITSSYDNTGSFSKHGSYFVRKITHPWRVFEMFRSHLVHFAA